MKILLVSFLLITSSLIAHTQETQTYNKDYGLEFNLVWPFVPGVEIYTLKLSNTVYMSNTMRGDLLTGLLIRPGTKNDPNAEIFREFGLGLGYRHYFVKGFHAELMLFPSYAQEVNNTIDGNDYNSFAMTTEFYTGYKFELNKKAKISYYLMPQAGIGYNVFSNLGPETEANAPFPVLSLQLGVNF